MNAARRPTRPDLSDWFDLDPLSAYIEAKAGRILTDAEDVAPEPLYDSAIVRVGQVLGDSGRWYRCWVQVASDPWQGACERGGRHDAQPDGTPCSHPVALAAYLCLHDPELARLAGLPQHLEAPA